jgi:hypothetical protein
MLPAHSAHSRIVLGFAAAPIMILAGTAGCAKTESSEMESKPIKLHVAVTRDSGQGAAEVVVRIVNNTDERILLDGTSMVWSVWSNDGQVVPGLPPPAPKPYERKGFLVVAPKQEELLRFPLRNVVARELIPEHGRIRCCYDSRGEEYPKGSNIWIGKACSNLASF